MAMRPSGKRTSPRSRSWRSRSTVCANSSRILGLLGWLEHRLADLEPPEEVELNLIHGQPLPPPAPRPFGRFEARLTVARFPGPQLLRQVLRGRRRRITFHGVDPHVPRADEGVHLAGPQRFPVLALERN